MTDFNLRRFLEEEKNEYVNNKTELENLKVKIDMLQGVLGYKNSLEDIEYGPIYALLSFVFPPSSAEQITFGFLNYIRSMKTYQKQIDNNPNSSKTIDRKRMIEEQKYKSVSLFGRLDFKLESLLEEYSRTLQWLKDNSQRNYRNKLVYHAIKNGLYVSKPLRESIYYQLLDKKLSMDVALYVMEELRIHNTKVTHPNLPIFNTVNIMMSEKNEPLEITSEEEIKYGVQDASLLQSYYKSLVTTDNLDQLLKDIQGTFASNEEFIYIIKNIINFQISEIENTKELLYSSYLEITDRKAAISLNKEEKANLSLLLSYYYEAINIQEEETEHIDEILEQEEEQDKNNLLFLDRGSYGQDTYFEHDLKSIPEQKYEEVKYLLTQFMKDNLPDKSVRQLVDYLRKFRELRGDQVRIIFKHLKGNDYLVLGVALKKDDVDNVMYTSLTGRFNDKRDYSYLHEQKDETLNRILTYINDNKRKGSR
ncbi:MAG: hypothetical protein K5666_05430 [Bacilli bacterium]|nr:hypothetical protein [Bacilli bacterium]